MSLFKSLNATAARRAVTVEFNGKPLQLDAEQTVAAALLAAGVSRFRSTPISSAPRAPYCMMGVCFECLMEIDGVASRQACLIQVRDGMTIRTQEGARDWSLDKTEASHGN